MCRFQNAEEKVRGKKYRVPERGGKSTREGAKSGMGRLERMKRGSGMKANRPLQICQTNRAKEGNRARPTFF
jgi:hypothetical protein